MSKSRSYCFTINNYTDDDISGLGEIPCRYVCYGHEVGASGTPHLQGYIYFPTPRTIGAVSKKLKRAHLSACKGTAQENIAYCSKEGGVFYERGERPKSPSEAGVLGSERYKIARELAREGKFDEIPDDLHARFDTYYLREYCRAKSKLIPESVPMISEWLWGPTGSGKSTAALSENPGAYLKMRNKWWDDYQYEPIVIIDDIDPTHELKFGAFLKDYADHHKFRVEIKGSSTIIRPLKIVVTSQYPIEGIFKDPETIAALKRRYRVRPFPPEGLHRYFGPVHCTADNYP